MDLFQFLSKKSNRPFQNRLKGVKREQKARFKTGNYTTMDCGTKMKVEASKQVANNLWHSLGECLPFLSNQTLVVQTPKLCQNVQGWYVELCNERVKTVVGVPTRA